MARRADGKFEKGESPNPGGVSKKVRALKEALTGDAVTAQMVVREALDNEDVEIRLEAAKIVFMYTLPKPATLVGEDPENRFKSYREMSTPELKALLAQQMAAK